MKTISKVSILICQVFLFQNGNAQNNPVLAIGTEHLNSKTSIPEKVTANNIDQCNALEYQNALLVMQTEQLTEAYNYLLQKVEKLKAEAGQYQKAIQESSINPVAKTFSCSNSHSSSLLCGDAFVETIVPSSYAENAIVTYFIPKDYKNANLNISDLNGKSVLEYNIDNSGYGQVIIPAGKLKYGTYNYCLLVDDRKMDCKKLIVLK